VKKTKILILGKRPPPYIGPAIATEIIINSTLRNEFELIHLDTSDHRPVNTLARIDFTNLWLALKQYLKLFIYILKYNPELVYIPAGQTKVGYLRDSVFLIITKLFSKKLLCHLRGGNFYNFYNGSGKLMKYYIMHIHRLVDGQIVLGNNLRMLFTGILSEEKIFVIPNGGNFNIKKSIRPKTLTILFVGNFIKTKGVMDVLNAFSMLSNFENLQLQLVGDWNEPETRKEIEYFLDNHPNLPINLVGIKMAEAKFEILSMASIFVFPTYYINEGHPWVIIEAMAAGLPIISTNHAAIPESVFDGVNGFLVEKRNPSQIAEKIQFLIDNPIIRQTMGKKSRTLYEQYFTEEIMINKLKIAIEKTLSKNR
jgi:glycosyltransferase involved in cell wall biosynthesis